MVDETPKSFKDLVQDANNQGKDGVNNLLKDDYPMLLHPDPAGYDANDQDKCRPFIDWTIANWASRVIPGNGNLRYNYIGDYYNSYKASHAIGVEDNQPVNTEFYGLTAKYIKYTYNGQGGHQLVVTLLDCNAFAIDNVDPQHPNHLEYLAVNAIRLNADGTFKDVQSLVAVKDANNQYHFDVPGAYGGQGGADDYASVVIVVANLIENGGKDEFQYKAEKK